MSKTKKVLVIAMVLVLVLGTVTIADEEFHKETLTATVGRIKFVVDGKDVTQEIEDMYGAPAFTVKEYASRSYVPVRAIAELMGLEVNWDAQTHTAELVDAKSDEYEKQLKEKDAKIAELEKEIKKLKGDEVDAADLKTTQNKLNKEYGTYEKVDFDISLKESKNKITINIVMDLYDGRQQSYWNQMRYDESKDMINDIVDIVAKDFKNVDITGSIYDDYSRRDVMTFSKGKNSKSVSISYASGGRYDYDYDDYYYIEDIVYKEFGNIYVDVDDVNIGNNYVDIDLYISPDEWENIKNTSNLLYFLDDISEEIFDDYYYYDYINNVTIYITIGNTREYTYTINYKDGSGYYK